MTGSIRYHRHPHAEEEGTCRWLWDHDCRRHSPGAEHAQVRGHRQWLGRHGRKGSHTGEPKGVIRCSWRLAKDGPAPLYIPIGFQHSGWSQVCKTEKEMYKSFRILLQMRNLGDNMPTTAQKKTADLVKVSNEPVWRKKPLVKVFCSQGWAHCLNRQQDRPPWACWIMSREQGAIDLLELPSDKGEKYPCKEGRGPRTAGGVGEEAPEGPRAARWTQKGCFPLTGLLAERQVALWAGHSDCCLLALPGFPALTHQERLGPVLNLLYEKPNFRMISQVAFRWITDNWWGGKWTEGWRSADTLSHLAHYSSSSCPPSPPCPPRRPPRDPQYVLLWFLENAESLSMWTESQLALQRTPRGAGLTQHHLADPPDAAGHGTAPHGAHLPTQPGFPATPTNCPPPPCPLGTMLQWTQPSVGPVDLPGHFSALYARVGNTGDFLILKEALVLSMMAAHQHPHWQGSRAPVHTQHLPRLWFPLV